MKRDLSGQTFERIWTLDRAGIDRDLRTIPAALSSEYPVRRYYGNEVLVHSADAINLERAADGLSMLWNHNTDLPIGIVESIKLDTDGKLRGRLRFSNNSKASEVWNDVSDGFLKDISISYSVDKWEEEAGGDTVRVTRWTLLEASVVTVPADHTVGMNRSLTGVKPMTDETKPENSGTTETAAPIVDITKMRREHVIAKKAGAAEAITAERQRIADLHELWELPLIPRNDFYDGLRARAIDEGWSLEGARKILMDVLSGEAEPVIEPAVQQDSIRVATHEGRLPPVVIPAKPGNQARNLGVVQMGQDALDKFREGCTQGLLIRSGMITKREDIQKAREGGMIGKSLNSLAGEYLRVIGESTLNLSDEAMAHRAYAHRASGQTTSDFTNILANVASKSMLMGWDEAPETWQLWTRRGQLPDFKTAEISGISGFTGLDEVPEDGDITYGKFTDRKETIKLVQYAKKYRLSRQAIINDDLRHFTAVPRAMGRAANAKVGDVTYALLNGTGPTLNQDSIALWDTSTHKNYVAAATAPNVTTLGTATVAMALQKDPNSTRVLNIRPRYLLVPVTLEATARTLMASQYDPAGSAGTLTPNPYNGRFEVVTDARLDGQTYGTAAWYLLGDPNIYDTVEVAFLNGIAEPYMRENPDWAGQGVEYMVGVDFGVSALDFRAMHKYRGN